MIPLRKRGEINENQNNEIKEHEGARELYQLNLHYNNISI